MPDTLALRPSSWMLGGTWEQREAEKLSPPRRVTATQIPSGPLSLAWTGRLPFPRFWGPTPVSDLATRIDVDLGVQQSPPWDLHTPAVPRHCATFSDILLCKVLGPPDPSGSPSNLLLGSPGRDPGVVISEGGAWVYLCTKPPRPVITVQARVAQSPGELAPPYLGILGHPWQVHTSHALLWGPGLP